MSQSEGDPAGQSLHRIAALLQQHTGETGALLEELVALLPEVFPGTPGIGARIQYGQLSRETPGWNGSVPEFSAGCGTRDGTAGRLEVTRAGRSEGRACLTAGQQHFLLSVAVMLQAELDRRAEAALRRRAEDMLSLARSTAGFASWEWELRSNTVQVIDPHGWLGGLGSDDAPDTFGRLRQAIHPEDRLAFDQAIDQLLTDPSRPDRCEAEFRVARPDGRSRWVAGRARLQRDPEGRPERVIGTALDVTGIRQLEDQLHQMQRIQQVGRIAATSVHDLNNYLMAIGGFAEILMGRTRRESPSHPLIQEILRATEKAAELSMDLLNLTHNRSLMPAWVDPNKIIERMKGLIVRLLGSEIELVVSLEPDASPVRVDPDRLEQVLLSLVTNARDAMPTGGTLTIRLERIDLRNGDRLAPRGILPGAYATIAVIDTGKGMDEATQARVFEPFFTTKPPGEGSGLGLSVAKTMIEQSGGHIVLGSAPGAGATFTIFLPRLERSAS
jgi:signal transduction histidine kinase